MKKTILTVGGGLAGIEASKTLADMGYSVSIIEKENDLGGKVNQWHQLFPDFRESSDVQDYIKQSTGSKDIMVFPGTEIASIEKKDNGFYVKSNKAVAFDIDAILLATGFEIFAAERKEEFGYGIYDNVITSVDLEQKFRKGGQFYNAGGKVPKRIAFIHCVGSRDAKTGNHYCSKVCCITGIKQAIELAKLIPGVEIFCFYMDLRMYGLEYEELYKTAQEKYGIQFIRGRLSEASENIDNSILIKCEDTLSGRPLKMNVDLVVLLVGMEAGEGTQNAGTICNVEFGSQRFISCRDAHLRRNLTTRDGIFTAGTCTGPMSIPETLENARSAALEIHKYLSEK